MWFNIVSFILAALALPEFISLLPEGSLQIIALLNAIGNMVLRMYFTEKALTPSN